MCRPDILLFCPSKSGVGRGLEGMFGGMLPPKHGKAVWRKNSFGHSVGLGKVTGD